MIFFPIGSLFYNQHYAEVKGTDPLTFGTIDNYRQRIFHRYYQQGQSTKNLQVIIYFPVYQEKCLHTFGLN